MTVRLVGDARLAAVRAVATAFVRTLHASKPERYGAEPSFFVLNERMADVTAEHAEELKDADMSASTTSGAIASEPRLGSAGVLNIPRASASETTPPAGRQPRRLRESA